MTGSAALLGALGTVGIVFGLLSFLLAMLGAPSDPFWIGANLVVGFVLIGISAALSVDGLRERMSSGEARRVGRYGTSAILSTLLTIAILAMGGFLAQRYPFRFDWSEAKVHSLSDQSLKLLAGLDRDVHAVAFFSPLEQTPVRDLLDRYVYASDHFRVEYVNPSERPDLIERYGIAPEDLGQGLVRIAIGEGVTQVGEVSEENITNAMVKLSRTADRKVYFLKGHNERAVEGEAAAEKESYARAADALRNENYEVETLLLAAAGDVPEDADVVIVAGATRPLLEEEHVALRRYLERGGAVLVLVDPRAKTDLVERVRDWGVDIGNDVIVDRKLAMFGRATTPFAGSYAPDHAITRDLQETTLFHLVRSVRSGEDAKGNFTEIVFTSGDSWAERDIDRFYAEGRAEFGGDDLQGPVSIAVAGTPDLGRAGSEPAEASDEDAPAGVSPPGEAHLAVFGDSDFASNELIEAYRNRDLFVNTVNWLLGDVEAISIRPALSRASRFQLTTEQFMNIRTLSLFVLPEAIAVLGVVTWWRRRYAPAG
ncbi:MAG: GldG family protein [Myxococcales bacterium]|nr:GldG family protein [Myxococcales bacterium]